jgi:hypothetical protein
MRKEEFVACVRYDLGICLGRLRTLTKIQSEYPDIRLRFELRTY